MRETIPQLQCIYCNITFFKRILQKEIEMFLPIFIFGHYKQESDTLILPTGLFSDTEDFDDMVGVKAVGENRVVDFCVGGG